MRAVTVEWSINGSSQVSEGNQAVSSQSAAWLLIVFVAIGRISGIELAGGRPRLKEGTQGGLYIMHGITVAIAIMRLGAVLSTMKIKLGECPSLGNGTKYLKCGTSLCAAESPPTCQA